MSGENDRPNVLLVTVDQWPGRLLGCAGHAVMQTPTLDALAADGTRYTRAYSECPACIPARQALMTGLSPRGLGNRVYREGTPMPDGVPTLARCFRDAGYQAQAVGKLHVYPQRDRIGFDDVTLVEEGRTQFGVTDDYEEYLATAGYAGQQFSHGMANNGYESRPWHLPEHLHVTNWITQQMAREIQRRDPLRPAFWYLSYTHPHPPLAPLASYLDIYRDAVVDDAALGSWAERDLPDALHSVRADEPPAYLTAQARRAFYALCTHVDHQLRIVLGTLREEGLLDNTIILITADHGDMLGEHRLWGKRLFYEYSANIPMILLSRIGDSRLQPGSVDDRLLGLPDVMPTLLDLAGLDVPDGVEGRSMVSGARRDVLYGEYDEADGHHASRMVHDGRYKLIYFPVGNYTQLFDLDTDPQERADLAESPDHAQIRGRLTAHLIDELYGPDEAWLSDGRLVGVPARAPLPSIRRNLAGQRGHH